MRKASIIVALLLLAAPVGAVTYGEPQPWERPHFFNGSIGFAGFGTIVAGQNGGFEYLNHGGGAGIWLGLDIGRFVGVRIGYDASFHNPGNSCATTPTFLWCGADFLYLETVQVDFKLRFPTGSRFAPYLIAGVDVAWLGRSSNLTAAAGGGFEAGGGFDVWVARNFSVGVEAKYRGIKMSDFATDQGSSTFLSLVQIAGNLAIRF